MRINIVSPHGTMTKSRKAFRTDVRFQFLFLLFFFSYLPSTFAARINIRHNNLIVTSDALHTTYFLRTSVTPQRARNSGRGTIGRLVRFQRQGRNLLMLELSRGQTPTPELGSDPLLASFPILRAYKNGSLEIDFAAGMNTASMGRGWQVTDFIASTEQTYDQESRTAGLRSVASYVREAKLFGPQDDGVDIALVTQTSAENGTNFPTYEMRYFLTPYSPDAQFISRENSPQNGVGFFQTPVFYQHVTGRETAHITRWNLDKRKEIIYHISQNTPEGLRDMVREGVLYWNRVFGRAAIRVELAPEGVYAPHPEMNVIQWVSWDNAPSAYADALADPITGEVASAQIYLPQSFIRSGMRATRSQVRYRSTQEHLCDWDMGDDWEELQSELQRMGADQDTAARIAKDYMRGTVAHEVGHTLGLRHNFMAHTAMNVSLAERDRIFEAYVLKGIDPPESLMLLSSVMDYPVYKDKVLLGRMIQLGRAPLPYDSKAIAFAYGLNPPQISPEPVYCSDGHVGVYLDCKTRYSGSQPIAFLHSKIKETFSNLTSDFLNVALTGLFPSDTRDRVEIQNLAWIPQGKAAQIAKNVGEIWEWLKPGVRSALVERQLGVVTSLNKDTARTLLIKEIRSQVHSLGGIAATFFPFQLGKKISEFSDSEAKSLEEKLSHLSTTGFQDESGQWRKLSAELKPEQVDFLRTKGKLYLEKIGEYLIEEMLDIYSEVQVASDLTELHDGLESGLKDFAMQVLFSESPNQTILGEVVFDKDLKPRILVKAYRYSFATRKKAVKILQAKSSPLAGWSLRARREVVERLMQTTQKSIGKPFHEIKPRDLLEGPLLQWFLEQVELINLLGKDVGCADLLMKQETKKL